MGNPITWRTVNGPSLGDPSRSMELASRSFNGMFSGLQDELKQREAIDAKNFLVQQENQKNAFLDSIAQYKTPEELAAATGALEAERAALNPLARAATRGAVDTRTTALRQQMQDAWRYQNAATDQTEAPIRDTISALTAQGKFKEADALLTQHTLRNEAVLYDGLRTGQRRVVTEDQVDKKFGFDTEEAARKQAEEGRKVSLFPLEQERIRAAISSSNASTSASNESVLNSRAQRERAETERLTALTAAKLGVALKDNIYKDGTATDGSAPELMKLMVDNEIGGSKTSGDAGLKRGKIMERFMALARDGILVEIKGTDGKPTSVERVPLPLGAVKAAILSSSDKALSWNEGWADTFEEKIKAELQKNTVVNGVPRNRTVDDFQAYQQIQRISAETPVGTTKAKKPKSQ